MSANESYPSTQKNQTILMESPEGNASLFCVLNGTHSTDVYFHYKSICESPSGSSWIPIGKSRSKPAGDERLFFAELQVPKKRNSTGKYGCSLRERGPPAAAHELLFICTSLFFFIFLLFQVAFFSF